MNLIASIQPHPSCRKTVTGAVLVTVAVFTKKHERNNPMTYKPKIPRRPLPAKGEGVTERLYLTPEQRRAWNWAAAKAGVPLHDFARHGGDELLRNIVADMGRRGENIAQNVAEYLTTLTP